MKNRQIVFTKPCVAKLLDTQIQAPGPDEVQVRLAVSTISSGTERANLVGELNISIGETKEVVFPRCSGYSSSGTVTAVGENVTEFHPGDRVAMSWTRHEQYINLDKNLVYRIPDEVSFYEAALFHISIFPLAAIRKVRLEIGESAVVMGMGVLGLLSIPLLKVAGAVPIIAVDPSEEKRKKALLAGADYALDPYASDFAETVKKLTDGGARTGIEVTGIGAGLDGILDCMAPFGRVALLGCTRNKEFHIDYYKKVHGPGITLIGAHTLARPAYESHGGWWTQRDDVLAVMKLSRAGRISLAKLTDEIHSPQEAPEIYTRLANESTFPLVQFDWSRLK